jgi:hypothetical protein
MNIGSLTDSLKEQLQKIVPSHDGSLEYRPCQVKLKDGRLINNVYIVDYDNYLRMWGVLPKDDPGKNYILIEDVTEIRESPNRLPARLANQLYEAGESGMGYCLFKVILDNGQSIDVVTGNAVDFIPLPNGMTTNNIKDVQAHRGSRENPKNGPAYYWCLFKETFSK